MSKGKRRPKGPNTPTSPNKKTWQSSRRLVALLWSLTMHDFITACTSRFLRVRREEALRLLPAIPRLSWLTFHGVSFREKQFELLAGLKGVTSLELEFCPISDGDLAALGKWTDLESLALSELSIGDAGLDNLPDLPRLKYLSLSKTQVGDKSLTRVGQWRNLRSLVLDGTRVTDAGLAAWRRWITWSG